MQFGQLKRVHHAAWRRGRWRGARQQWVKVHRIAIVHPSAPVADMSETSEYPAFLAFSVDATLAQSAEASGTIGLVRTR
jgi:hypothetical protein